MNYSLIRKFDIANGEGIRVSLFVSGCNFHCEDCFNSEAWDFNHGELFTQKTFEEIVNLVKNPNISGLSILGGDPLWQDTFDLIELQELCRAVHKANKTVWIWSGFTWEEIFPIIPPISPIKDFALKRSLIANCDVWIDGRFDKNLKDLRLKWRGSSNQRVVDVQESLKHDKIILWEK